MRPFAEGIGVIHVDVVNLESLLDTLATGILTAFTTAQWNIIILIERLSVVKGISAHRLLLLLANRPCW